MPSADSTTPPHGTAELDAQLSVARLRALAQDAACVAAARRTLYLAYVAEGFTEQQALHLVTFSG